LYAIIVGVGDEDTIVVVVDRQGDRVTERAWFVAVPAELGHERAVITREYLHPMVAEIDNQQEASMMVERQAEGHRECTIGRAL